MTVESDSGRGVLTAEIWRGGADGHYCRYAVPRQSSQTVLDVVTWIQRHREPALAYRFACRVGVCGSCAMTVNGKPRWTCRTHVAKVAADGWLTVGPLDNLPVIRDLAVDMDPFFAKWQRARGRYAGSGSRRDPLAAIAPASPERAAADAAIECINCAVCYAACDVVARRADYLGPAALNRAWAACNDVRDASRGAVLDAVSGDAGCHRCHNQQSCTEHCPVGIDPNASIAGLKRASLLRRLPASRRP